MPKQKEQYEDALGSIFDFIYSESQKSPKKVKPMKVTGIDGTSELSDALVGILENPLLFVNDTTMGNLKEALDINLAEFKLGDRGGKVAINVQDIGKIITDPRGYVDNAFKKMEGIRKMQRATHGGEIMKSVLGGMWARRNGMDWDSQKALMVAGRPQAFQQDMMAKNGELLRDHFVSGTKKMTLTDFQNRYGVGTNKAKDLYKEYQDWETAYSSGEFEKKTGVVENKKVYSVLQGHEFDLKARTATSPGDKEKFESARTFVDNIGVISEIREYQKQAKDSIDIYTNEIERLKRIPGSKSLIAQNRSKIRELKSNSRIAGAYYLAGQLGTLDGNWNSAKQLFNGDLLPNIINGKFFEDKYNQISWLQPSKEDELKTALGPAIKLHMGKKGKSDFSNRYFESMNSLYYLSPGTWAKTLATGEGFAYIAKIAEKNFKKDMESLLTSSVPGFNMNTFLQDIMNGNGSTAIAGLGTMSSANLKKIEKFAKKYKRFGDLGYTFGALARVRKKATDFFEKKVARGIRLRIGIALLKVGFVKKFSSEIIKSWMKSGGMYTLLRGVTTAALQAIGFTVAGPIGNFVVTVVSGFVTDVLLKAAKPMLKFGLEFVLILLVGIFGVLILSGSWFMSIFGQYSHVSPQQVVQCGAFAGTDYIVDDPDDPGGITPPVPIGEFVAGALPSGEECLLGEASYSCTQGAYGSYSHQNVAAIDVGGVSYFHAPAFCGNGGTCKVTYVGDVNCRAGYAGGMVKFTAEYKGQTYEFKLIHVDTSMGNGQDLTSGQRVARVMTHAETTSACSSGKHLHMSTTLNGVTVNPYDVMTKPVSEGGFGCGISACR